MKKKVTVSVLSEFSTQKNVSVWIDATTLEILEQIDDDDLKRQYIIEEYKSSLIDRKETRRHTSLDNCLYVKDKRADIDKDMDKRALYSALGLLTDKQREVFISHVLERKSFREIGDDIGIHKQTVLEIYNAAVKKLKKLLE